MTAALLALVVALAPSGPPPTRRAPVTDVYHGVKVTDPYRWLENQTAPETRKWIDAQNRYTDSLLKHQPSMPYLKRRFTEMLKIENVSAPMQRSGRFFYTRQRPQDEQAILYWRDGLNGKDHLFLDPNLLDKNHTVTASYLDFSDDGRYAAYQIRHGGADETTIHIRDISTGKELPDGLPLANYWGFSLAGDMSGYYYVPHVNLVGARLRWHKIGTPASADTEVFGKGLNAEYGVGGDVTRNRKWLIITVNKGWDKSEVYVQNRQTGVITPVVTGFDANYLPFSAEDTLYIITDKKSPTRSIISYDMNDLAAGPKEVVPPRKDSIESATLAGGRLYVSWLHNVALRATIHSPDGKQIGEIPFPGIGQGSLPIGRWESKLAFIGFTSYATPDQIYSYDIDSNKLKLWHDTKIPGFDPKKITTKQVWFTSKDGTKVPMFLVYRKGLKMDGRRPTLLYGYGGFDSDELPYFSRSAVLFAENGGVFADVSLRGGGEFGEAWHQAGMLGNKQHVFDDFIAAGEWLIKNHVTAKDKLTIRGGSNGGLLVGAAVTQRPDLFQAALCEVPLLDMLRYDLFLQGPQWVPEYGSAKDPEQFKWIYAYSPYQHVKKGVAYPAVLFDSGDGDTRVAPLHARKMTALMQWATSSRRPILLHYDTSAGHSGGESLTKEVDHAALEMAFLFWQLGVRAR